MIDVKEDVALAPLTTFQIGGAAEYFVEVKTEDELREALREAERTVRATRRASSVQTKTQPSVRRAYGLGFVVGILFSAGILGLVAWLR